MRLPHKSGRIKYTVAGGHGIMTTKWSLYLRIPVCAFTAQIRAHQTYRGQRPRYNVRISNEQGSFRYSWILSCLHEQKSEYAGNYRANARERDGAQRNRALRASSSAFNNRSPANKPQRNRTSCRLPQSLSPPRHSIVPLERIHRKSNEKRGR